MSILWSAKDFAAAIAPISVAGDFSDVNGISIDSRTVAQGDAFFAIKGDRFDGHAFARKALEAGAAVVVLEEAQRAEFADLKDGAVFVDDVLAALERLGRAARARTRGKIIAVTGSVGKTSTKDALRSALAASGKVHAAVSSFNNHWGVPLTLARMPADIDYGIFEVGMNHAGEIRTLIAMVQPHIAMITTVVAAHIGNFENLDAIADAKAEIFEGVVEGGAVLINADNHYADYLSQKAQALDIARVATFGQKAGSDIHLQQVQLTSEGTDISLSVFGKELAGHLATVGEHLATNAVAVLGAVSLAEGDVTAALEALSCHGATKGRGQRHALSVGDGSFVLIDESYNANPSSVEAALKSMNFGQNIGRRIVVLGDMLELGDESRAMHEGLLPEIEDCGIDRVYLCGSMMAHLWENLPIPLRGSYANSSENLIEPLKHDVQAGDLVMVKGSLGSRMGPIVAALVDAFKN